MVVISTGVFVYPGMGVTPLHVQLFLQNTSRSACMGVCMCLHRHECAHRSQGQTGVFCHFVLISLCLESFR
jgi:hypothetical protein